MDDANNRPDIFGVRPVLAIDAEMLCRIFVRIRYRNVALATARLNNEAAALARGFLQRMRRIAAIMVLFIGMSGYRVKRTVAGSRQNRELPR
jgi:hypothetical protein